MCLRNTAGGGTEKQLRTKNVGIKVKSAKVIGSIGKTRCSKNLSLPSPEPSTLTYRDEETETKDGIQDQMEEADGVAEKKPS